MSAYKTIKTQMRDPQVLKVALENAKPEWKGVVTAEGDSAKITIRGDSNMNGVLCVPKGKAGTYSDIGVVRGKDGSLSWKISDVDTGDYYHDAETRKAKGLLFGKEWQTGMQAEYGLMERVQAATKVGAEIGHREVFNHPQWGQVPGHKIRIRKSSTMA